MHKKETLIIGTILLILVGIFTFNYTKDTKALAQTETKTVVKATFSARESTDDPNDTCFQLEGSKRSFYNEAQYTQKTKFEVVKAVDESGQECVREILADGKTYEKPADGDLCLPYKLPKPYCKGYRGCILVYDFCI